MLELVDVGSRTLESYRGIVPDHILDDLANMHDPQPVAILPICGKGGPAGFGAAIFTMREFVPPDMPIRRTEIIPPAIDPASPKNLPLSKNTARQVLDWLGVRTDLPLVNKFRALILGRINWESSRHSARSENNSRTCNSCLPAPWRWTTRRLGSVQEDPLGSRRRSPSYTCYYQYTRRGQH